MKLSTTHPPAREGRSYFHSRIEAIGLTETEARRRYGIEEDTATGDLLLTTRHFNGEPVQYVPDALKARFERQRATKTARESNYRGYFATHTVRRFHPSRVRGGFKYKNPKGQTARPAPMPLAIDAFSSGLTGGSVTFIEGLLKAAALDRVGVETVAFGGIGLYRLSPEIREYLEARMLTNVNIFYDADALDLRPKNGRYDTKRLQNFLASVRKFAGELFDFLSETGNDNCRVNFLMIRPDSEQKGADDVLATLADPAPFLAEMNTPGEGQYITGFRLFPTTYEAKLSAFFGLDSPEAFYQRHREAVGGGGFTWKGLHFATGAGRPVMISDPFDTELTTLPLAINRYLGEREDYLDNVLNGNPRLAIESPTGSGKTTYLIEYAKRTGARLVLSVPTRSLCRQLGAKHGIPAIYGKRHSERAADTAAAPILVCTYDTVGHVYDLDNRTLVIDECHNIVNQYGKTRRGRNVFRADALTRLLKAAERCRRVVYLSGTMPRLFLKAYDVPLVTVERKHNPRVRLHEIEPHNATTEAVTAALLTRLIEDVKGEKVSFVLFNNTDRLDIIRGALIDGGHLATAQIQVMSRRHYDRGETTGIDDISRIERVREGVRLVLCTSILAEGVNVNNTDVGRVYVAGVRCPDTIRQFAARFRSVPTLDLYLVAPRVGAPRKGFVRKGTDELEDQLEIGERAAVRATREVATYGDLAGGYSRSDFFPHLCPNDAKDGYTVDRLSILAAIHQRRIETAPPSYLLARLTAYDGIELAGELSAAPDPATVHQLKEAAADLAQREADLVAAVTADLIERPEVVTAALVTHYKRKGDRRAANALTDLVPTWITTADPTTVLAWLDEYRGRINKQARELIRRRAQLHFAGVADPVPWLDLKREAWAKEWKVLNTYHGLRVLSDPGQARHLSTGHRLDLKAKQMIADTLAAVTGPIADHQLADLLRNIFTHVDGRSGVLKAVCLVNLTRGGYVALAGELFRLDIKRHGTRKVIRIGPRHGELSTGTDLVAISPNFQHNPLLVKALRPPI